MDHTNEDVTKMMPTPRRSSYFLFKIIGRLTDYFGGPPVIRTDRANLGTYDSGRVDQRYIEKFIVFPTFISLIAARLQPTIKSRFLPLRLRKRYRVYATEMTKQPIKGREIYSPGEDTIHFYLGAATEQQVQHLKTMDYRMLDIIARGGPVNKCELENTFRSQRRAIYSYNVLRYLFHEEDRTKLPVIEPKRPLLLEDVPKDRQRGYG